MKAVISIARWVLLIVAVIASAGCHRLVVPATPPSSRVTLKSYHARYVLAQGKEQDWSLRQAAAPGLDGCGWFTRYDLGQDSMGNDVIALKTCNDRFVTAPRKGTSRLDWEVWQESGLGDCGMFTLEPQGGWFALKTCSGKYLTAGDAGVEWPAPWMVVVEADQVRDWERFEILPQP